MVGVPGKFKGCNTCRTRRVKCDNTRPFCKKCTDYGRDCGGYERETVFIVGTPDDKGRCASHPPRNVSSSRKSPARSRSRKAKARMPTYSAAEPRQPAWDETVDLKTASESHRARIVAHQTDLDVALQGASSAHEDGFALSLSSYQPLDVTPHFSQEDFHLRSSCLIQAPPPEAGSSVVPPDEDMCLFLYEQNASASYNNQPQWLDPTLLSDPIRDLGPAAYQDFPAHHFFARIYRPNAIWAALLNRQPTFLCSPEWTVVPWEHYPRTALDDLLDVVVLLPSIFSRADRITPLEPSIARRLKAKDLLSNCANIETQFDIWYGMLQQKAGQAPLCWVADPTTGTTTHSPCGDQLEFATPLTGLVHVYYWAVLILFHQCIYALIGVMLEPEGAGSADPATSSALPPGIEIQKYQPTETRVLASNMCRSLDFVLGTTGQPELLASPLWVVTQFFNGMMHYGDGELERLWCTGFQGRLEARTREMGVWLQDKRWLELGQFG
ncbi:hypothetical protein GGR56DRAFT_688150 [Xylariaceae sp. FL0804]|nr:hypothetical protein GGR56DRAFT_688150 [Xylariaceae sp. FL0804]